MGHLSNGIFWTDEKRLWCAEKCVNDQDFFIPYKPTDELYFQLNLAEFVGGMGYNVCEVHAIDLNGNRIIQNLMGTYGSAIWRKNKNIATGLNIFTIKIPPHFGGCDTVVTSDDCCVIDIWNTPLYSLINDMHYGGEVVTSAQLTYNGVTYTAAQLQANIMPPGWHWFVQSPVRWIQLPDCELVDDVHIEGLMADGSTYDAYFVAMPCPIEFCSCYIDIPLATYNTINEIHVNGTVYSVAPGSSIFNNNPSLVPGISPSTQHTNNLGIMRIPVDCKLRDLSVQFYFPGAGGGDIPEGRERYFFTIVKTGCEPTGVTIQSFKCFAFEFVICKETVVQFSVFTEPFDCGLCDKTIVVESTYNIFGRSDCLGQYYHLDDDNLGTSNSGGLMLYKNKLRIPAILRKLPGKLAVSKNERSFSYKSEWLRVWEMQGVKLFPPYYATMIEAVFLGSDFFIDGTEYQFRGEKIFDRVSDAGFLSYQTRVELLSENCETIFDCV